MKNAVRVNRVIRKENRIEYEYTVEGEWKECFNQEIPFWSEYSVKTEQIPESVAVLPFVGNLVLMASLLDADIYVNELDLDFYSCIDSFLEGFARMSPDVYFKRAGILHVNKLVNNQMKSNAGESLLFFSGGVDAWSSLLSHLEEKPALVSVWGADIPYDNGNAWEEALGNCRKVADRYGLDLLTVRSTLRRFINEEKLNELAYSWVNDNWWSAFQHSVGMMCLAAPYIQGQRKTIYFAGTYSSKDKKEWGTYVTASDPTIDNHVRFCGSRVVHDGYEFSRHDKIIRICQHFQTDPDKPYLRVCFSSDQGTNCGSCEKCANTIMSILLAGQEPESYGLPYAPDRFAVNFAAGMQEMAREEKYAFLSFYYDIQKAYRQKYSIDEVPEQLKIFYQNDLEALADFLHVPCNKCEAGKWIKPYLKEVLKGKDWLEQECKARGEWIQELEAAKVWLEQDTAEKEQWIRKLEKEKQRLETENRVWKEAQGK